MWRLPDGAAYYEALLGNYTTTDLTADEIHAIGLREVAELPRDEAVEAITRRTLQYAAYQRKWMRRIPGLVPLEADRPPDGVAADVLAAVGRFPLLGGQEAAASGVRKGEADHTGHAV